MVQSKRATWMDIILSKTFCQKKPQKPHTHTRTKKTNKQTKKNNHSKLVEMSEPINIPLFINVTDQWWLLRLIWIV